MELVKRLVHINTKDSGGGAAGLAWALMSAQRMQGLDARFVSGCRHCDVAFSEQFPIAPDRDLESLCKTEGLLDWEFQGSHELVRHSSIVGADLLHFHNLHGGYFHPFSLFLLSQLRPCVWTLHDMQALTGHCAHAFNCKRFVTGCFTCPDLNVYPSVAKDRAATLWQWKAWVSERSPLSLVVPSEWLRRKVSCSFLSHHPIEVIPNGVDLSVFRATPKSRARELLNLPVDGLIIGAVADGGPTGNPWKGGEYVADVLQKLWHQYPDLYYLNIGGLSQYEHPRLLSVQKVDDTHVMALLLSALDIFFYPTVADNCPLVVIEALSCGTPVVAFNTGGVPELIRNGKTGFVTPYRDGTAIFKATEQLINDGLLRQEFSLAAVADSMERFGFDRMVHRYSGFYEQVIASWQDRRSEMNVFGLTSELIHELPPEVRTNTFHDAFEEVQQRTSSN